MAAVRAEDELSLRCYNLHERFARRRKCNGKTRAASGVGQDADKPGHTGRGRVGAEGMLGFEANQVAGVAEHNLRFEGQFTMQNRAKLRPRTRFKRN